FAKVYNKWCVEFANIMAPRILKYYENTPISATSRGILDLCCGTGQLAVYFLENNFNVLGIDLSDAMLAYARKNAAEYVQGGQAEFRKANAVDFAVDQQFGLVTSTFDSLNHLTDFKALEKCFRTVHATLLNDGFFIFDMNTRLGLDRWNEIFIQDTEESMIITRGIYDGQSDKAQMRISGFVQTVNGNYERFTETICNTVFNLEEVKAKLLEIGWKTAHITTVEDLSKPIKNPEKERRVFFVAQK
ncbi:MAG: class I SAM-dependent DNA methyltransferase, partial [Candidatus Hodarchaeales archaeon]